MPAKVEGRPVDSVTRVTVAFPFSTIRIGAADEEPVIQEMAGLLAGLAAELDARQRSDASTDLVARTTALVARLASA